MLVQVVLEGVLVELVRQGELPVACQFLFKYCLHRVELVFIFLHAVVQRLLELQNFAVFLGTQIER